MSDSSRPIGRSKRFASSGPHRLAVLLLGIALQALAASGSLAADDADASPSRWSAGVGIGYGHSLQFPRHPDGLDVVGMQMLMLHGQVRYRLGEWGEPLSFGRSALDFMVEGQLVVNFVPDTGSGGGFTGGFRYALNADRAWSPYVLGLAGVGGTNYGLQNQDDGFQFWLQGGVGLRRTLRDRLGLTLELRYHHISNLGTHLPNAGIDSIVTAIGLDF